MQAPSTSWFPPAGVLGDILASVRARLPQLRARRESLERMADEAPRPPSLRAALLRAANVAVIAEVKRRSPSKGVLRASIVAAERAAVYERSGAAAVSVLTEPEWFGGSPEDLAEVTSHIALPVLRKDFIVDPMQLLEARALGASAALLIARALPQPDLEALAQAAEAAGLEVLFEVRSAEELEHVLSAGARLVGVNCRDLETLKVDPALHGALLGAIPEGVVRVAESGIRSASDVEAVARDGADAVLVGSLLSECAEPAERLRALTSVPRRTR